MEAGKLRHRITIQTGVVTENDHGQDDTTWTTYAARVPAEVKQTGSRELFQAQQQKSDLTHAVSIRWMRGLDAKTQVIWHDGTTDRTLAVEGPPLNPDGKRKELIFICKETG